VAGEVRADLFHAFTKSLRCATLQGWMREWDSEGRVRHALRPEAEAAARNAQATVFSMDDVGGDEAQAVRLATLSPVCAVTDGENGCRVFWEGRTRSFPAPNVEAVDPTGAGDIFAAVFFLRFKECGDAWEAGRMATALASRSVTRPGLAGVPTRGEILEAKRIGETA
jgi:sugar/nucleoside kinase (ribokinase family)